MHTLAKLFDCLIILLQYYLLYYTCTYTEYLILYVHVDKKDYLMKCAEIEICGHKVRIIQQKNFDKEFSIAESIVLMLWL